MISSMAEVERDVGGPDEMVRISVYLERALLARLVAAAKLERRSMSGEVAVALVEYLHRLDDLYK